MATAQLAAEQCVLLDHISWDTYETLLEETNNRRLRLTYDEGSLEIMTISLGHEIYGGLIGRMIETLTLILNIAILGGGSTTLKVALKKKGLEPDECYWIKNEPEMRGKTDFDIGSDPPPDLAVEVDIFHSSLDRMAIYAALRVPEVWRFDGLTLKVYRLRAGKYKEATSSHCFPFLPLGKLVEFIGRSGSQNQTSLLRSFARWVRSDILPVYKKANGGPKK